MRTTLASRAIVHHFVAKDIAVNAEVVLAALTLIPAAFACAFSALRSGIRLIVFGAICDLLRRWNRRKIGKATEALHAALLPCSLPRHLCPVSEGEEMVVRSGQMSRQDQCKVTSWTCRW